MSLVEFKQARHNIMAALGSKASGVLDTPPDEYFGLRVCFEIFGDCCIDFNAFEVQYTPEKVAVLFLEKAGLAVEVMATWGLDVCTLDILGDPVHEITVKDLDAYSDLRVALADYIAQKSSKCVVTLPPVGTNESLYAVVPKALARDIDCLGEHFLPVEYLIKALEHRSLGAMYALLSCASDENHYANALSDAGDRPIFAAIRTGDAAFVKEVMELSSPFLPNGAGLTAVKYAEQYFSPQEVATLFDDWAPEDWPQAS